MSDIKGKYKKILEDLENNIKDPEDLIYAKEKFMEVSMLFMDIIDRLTILTEARIKEIEEKQGEIENKISSVQSLVDEIEGDIYEDDGNYEFEIVCPYCNYEFFIDIDENKTEITCPECQNVIELDWTGDTEENDSHNCNGSCGGCHGCDEEGEEDDM